jgi:hypothetical protein
MSASLVYTVLRQILLLLTQLARGAKDVELLVLRYQLAVLRRAGTPPRFAARGSNGYQAPSYAGADYP